MVKPHGEKGIDWRSVAREDDEALTAFLSGDGLQIKAFLIILVALVTFAYILYRALFGGLSVKAESALVVGLVQVYVFLVYPIKGKWNDKFHLYFLIDYCCIFCSLAIMIYTMCGETYTSTETLRVRVFSEWYYVDSLMGIIVILLIIEACRRSMNWIVAVLPLMLAGYSLFASHFPGEFANPSVHWSYLVQELYVSGGSGIYGIGTKYLIEQVFLFLLFSSFLSQTRAGCFFFSFANSLVGHRIGGAAKVSVVSSMLFSMISGSGVANVAVDGAITIPLMKRSGFRPADAGAIESVASNGGQFTPPVMGAAAFLIAGLLGASYLQICLWAALPALLYYLTIYITVHQRAVTLRIAVAEKRVLPSFRQVMSEGWFFWIPVAVLVACMARGYSLGMSAAVGVLATILVSFIKDETRLSPLGILRSIVVGVRMTSMISAACILTGVILTTIESTGFGTKLYQLMILLSGNSMLIGLVLAAAIAIVLGMGMPTLLVYVTMLVFVIPALISLGVNQVAAHLFAFYFGIVSGITPPVCLTAYTAAPIAGASFMKVGLSAARIGLASFLLPFIFVMNPQLLLQNVSNSMDLIVPLIGAVIGLSFFAVGVEGRFLRTMNIPERVISILAGGLLSLAPQMIVRLSALVFIVLVVLLQTSIIGRPKEVEI